VEMHVMERTKPNVSEEVNLTLGEKKHKQLSLI
jgi:hypothetical protein